MNKRQAKRLLNVARALRECDGPEGAFDMSSFTWHGVNHHDGTGYPCGTPACALEKFVARKRGGK